MVDDEEFGLHIGRYCNCVGPSHRYTAIISKDNFFNNCSKYSGSIPWSNGRHRDKCSLGINTVTQTQPTLKAIHFSQ